MELTTEVYKNPPRRKIVGKDKEVTETLLKSHGGKKVLVETIRRRTERVLVLECGHTVSEVGFGVIPKNHTQCWECYFEAEDKANGETSPQG